MNFDMLSLEIFIELSQNQSFTTTGKRIGRTQSAVSQQIAKLENALGSPLFKRNKKLTLTKNGELFLQYAKQIVSLQHEAIDLFQQPDVSGEVRFGIPEDFASLFLKDVLVDFFRIHPRVRLNVECDLTLKLFDRFKNKEFDLVLLKMKYLEDFPYGQNVWTEALEWVGNSMLLDASKPIPLVLSPSPCVNRASAIDALEKQGRKWRQVFSSPSYSGIIAAVKAGMGISVLPRNFIPKDMQILYDPSLPKLKNTHTTLLKNRDDNSAVNSFEKFVMQRLQRHVNNH